MRNKEAMQKKDKEIRELNSKLSMLELEVGQSDYVSKMSSERNQEKNGELKVRVCLCVSMVFHYVLLGWPMKQKFWKKVYIHSSFF